MLKSAGNSAQRAHTGNDGARFNLGPGFDRSAGPSAARAEGIEPGVKAVHLGRIVAIRCEISPLMGIVGR